MQQSDRARISVVVFAIPLAVALSGCSITELKYETLEEPAEYQSGTVFVEPEATGFSGGRVGWGRITIFSIPVVPIHIKSDEASDLMDVVSDALIATGYSTQVATGNQPGPVLSAHVDEIRFNNYTWIAPLVPTWGRIGLTLRLRSPDGLTVWEQSFFSKGNTFNFTDGYNIAATKIITKLANDMIDAFGSLEFNAAVAPMSAMENVRQGR